jgi:hypothetical protein
MKSLRARVNAGYIVRSGAAITMLWAAALGQATPDANIPEPGILPLLAVGAIAMFVLRRRK